MKRLIFSLAATILALTGAKATITLQKIYANNMVIQQKSVFPVKGKTTPNVRVRVTASWDNVSVEDSSDANGNFCVNLNAPEASTKYYNIKIYELKKRGTQWVAASSKILNPVYVGEVWLCSGQSNMAMPVQGTWGLVNNYAEEVANADYPYIKLFTVKASGECNHPSDSVMASMQWTNCSPTSIGNFSACAYFYGRELYKKLNIPIGLISCSYGGANAEAWASYETLKKIPAVSTTLTKCEKYDFDRDSVSKYLGMTNEMQVPTLLYNTMIHPLIAFPIRGAIWYQGEANVGGYNYYTALMDSLITGWRQDWGYNFPFYYVQLAGYQKKVDIQPSSSYAWLRWSQWKTLADLDSVGMATAVDIGNQTDIHPKNKQEVGRRLALVALKNTYGFDVVDKAPVPVSYSYGYRTATITFDKKIHVRNDSIPIGFLFQDRTYGNYYKGTVELLNDTTLQVSVTRPVRPKCILYNWADYPVGNIYGENDLPVLPFRTDDMDLVNGIETVKTGKARSDNNVYTTDGILIRKNVAEGDAAENLPKGIYIIGNKKKIIK